MNHNYMKEEKKQVDVLGSPRTDSILETKISINWNDISGLEAIIGQKKPFHTNNSIDKTPTNNNSDIVNAGVFIHNGSMFEEVKQRDPLKI